MAAGTPPAAAGAASPARGATVGNPLSRIPTPVLLGLGGAVFGLGYALIRDRKKAADVPPADTTATDAAPYDVSATIPAPVGYVSGGPVQDTSAETVGAVGQTALETLSTSLVDLVTGVLAARLNPDLAGTVALPASGPPPPATPEPPPSAPSPAPAPSCAAGYPRTNQVHTRKGVKTFSGACGIKSIFRDEKSGVEGFHVAYQSGRKLERWHYDFKGKNEGFWRHVWTGTW